DPSSRSVGLVTESQYSGAVVSYLSIGQSVLLIWPHLVAMFAIAVVLFAIAYVCFMKQEIRA
ncbi:MAG: ABC transporter permease, partial [Lachnospiraceae bacterium]